MASNSSPQCKRGEIRDKLHSKEIPYVIVLTRCFIPTCYWRKCKGSEIGRAAFPALTQLTGGAVLATPGLQTLKAGVEGRSAMTHKNLIYFECLTRGPGRE